MGIPQYLCLLAFCASCVCQVDGRSSKSELLSCFSEDEKLFQADRNVLVVIQLLWTGRVPQSSTIAALCSVICSRSRETNYGSSSSSKSLIKVTSTLKLLFIYTLKKKKRKIILVCVNQSHYSNCHASHIADRILKTRWIENIKTKTKIQPCSDCRIVMVCPHPYLRHRRCSSRCSSDFLL